MSWFMAAGVVDEAKNFAAKKLDFPRVEKHIEIYAFSPGKL